MILDNLRFIYDQNQDKQPLFVRNLLKEQLQYFILNYIYNSSWGEKFIFKGGTCLRFCFALPRLSEDLDFDVEDFGRFSFDDFISDLKAYFISKLKYKDIEIKIGGLNKIIYIRFPILGQIGVDINKPTENLLFVRIDLAQVEGDFFQKELSLKSTFDFSFLIRRYSLSDLYSGKIAAILQREKFEGKKKIPRFKGRDFFDLWFLKEKNIKWNKKYLASLINLSGEREIKKKLNSKISQAVKRKSELKSDLLPFMENPVFVEDFINNLESLKI